MAKLLYGDRIGRQAQLKTGCAAVIGDDSGQKVLLTRRDDNGLWCLPGGGMEPGESAAECCAREVLEETGLRVEVGKLIGVYTSPHRIVEYGSGNRLQFVSLTFEATVVGGELQLSDETTAFGYYSRREIESIDLMENHQERLDDFFAGQATTFVR